MRSGVNISRSSSQPEHEIVYEQSLLHALMESIPDCIYFKDAACRYTRINQAQAEVMGIADPAEAIGKTDFDFFSPEQAENFYAVEQEIIRSGQALVSNIEELKRPDGSTKWFSNTEVPIRDAGGGVAGLVGISRDISSEMLVRAQLKEAKEAAEKASHSKSEFLANMSHEIRTPMNGIMGMTELALETELTAEQREQLNTIKISANSLMGVINDILDFSKVEAGKLDFECIDFNLRDSLAEIMKSALRTNQVKIKLACQVASDVPEIIAGDPTRLGQVLINLMSNALKFTERGEVAIAVTVESQEAEEVCLHFSVSDTGIGIPADKQQGIFEAFSQADSSTTRRFGGTGLGLTISSRLVAMMKGRIWVNSEVGRGSTFHFIGRFAKRACSALTANESRTSFEEQAALCTRGV